MLKHGLMPMRNLSETESPAVDTRMLEFVERRREEQARARRQRTQLIAIAALGVIGVVLTISNAVLVSRLLARPVAPPVVNPPPVRSAAPPPVDTLERGTAMASGPVPVPPEPGEPASAPAPVPPAAPRPVSRPPAPSPDVSASARSMPQREAEPPALPEPATRGSGAATATGKARITASRGMLTSAETDPALRTARWMIHTYGPLDAESKALAAAQFYTGDERAFWRRVVRHVRTER